MYPSCHTTSIQLLWSKKLFQRIPRFFESVVKFRFSRKVTKVWQNLPLIYHISINNVYNNYSFFEVVECRKISYSFPNNFSFICRKKIWMIVSMLGWNLHICKKKMICLRLQIKWKISSNFFGLLRKPEYCGAALETLIAIVIWATL